MNDNQQQKGKNFSGRFAWRMCLLFMFGITYAVLVGIAMVIAQYSFARYWFASHQRGPLEGIWRKLTWIRSLK